MRVRLSLCVVPVCVLAVCAAAITGIAAADPAPIDKDMAAAHYKQGTELYKAGKFDAAFDEYEGAYKLLPRPLVIYHMARAKQAAGKLVEALALYRRYLSEQPSGKAASDARTQADAIAKQLASSAAAAPSSPPRGTAPSADASPGAARPATSPDGASRPGANSPDATSPGTPAGTTSNRAPSTSPASQRDAPRTITPPTPSGASPGAARTPGSGASSPGGQSGATSPPVVAHTDRSKVPTPSAATTEPAPGTRVPDLRPERVTPRLQAANSEPKITVVAPAQRTSTRRYGWLAVAAGAGLAGVLIDAVPASASNGRFDAVDIVPVGLYGAAALAVAHGLGWL